MKEIKLNNYYEKLSMVQKAKHAEKQGMLCYYEWLDTLSEECSPEEAGYILLALLHYDRYGGAVALPDFLAEKISSDRALKMLFTLCMDKIAAASREWINKHRLKAKSDEELTEQEIKVAEELVRKQKEKTEEDNPNVELPF